MYINVGSNCIEQRVGVTNPPSCKSVKKISKRNVKKEKLFERSEFFSFSEERWFLAFSCQRRDFLFTFFSWRIGEKRKS